MTWVSERLAACADPAVWTFRVPARDLLAQAGAVEARRRSGETLPLYGVPFAVKDNIDVAGIPTTIGCPAAAYVPTESAPVVRRLQEAGALLVGKTNLDQFATGLAGDRTPYGTCRNLFDPAFIAGGSSSGSGVAVAGGFASFALGTDTAGSGRVPAGCNNIVGLKPTPGLLSTEGVVPACRSLDCVSLLTLTVADAVAVWNVVAAGTTSLVPPGRSVPSVSAFAVPRNEDLEFFGDTEQEALFRSAVQRLVRLGERQVPQDLTRFRAVASLLYEGPWLAERLAGVGDYLPRHREALHPVTRAILEQGAGVTGVEVFRGLDRLRDLRATCLKVFEHAEILVVPTFPTIPTLEQVHADSLTWSKRLGHYTNFVNLLGLAALAVPAGFTSRGLPGGITLIGPAGSERRLCQVGSAWQQLAGLPLGATGAPLPAVPDVPAPTPKGWVRVSVAGAHLRGQPLHRSLLETGAEFVRPARTAPCYRFMAFVDLKPPRPGLLRVDAGGGSVRVELYDLPMEGFGRLVASVAPPLAIGTVELDNGETVKGFLCESSAAARARDITAFGGWTAFLEGRGSSAAPA
jgi:allophanate hydrolase